MKKKLKLHRVTLRDLDSSVLEAVAGGDTNTSNCPTHLSTCLGCNNSTSACQGGSQGATCTGCTCSTCMSTSCGGCC